MTIEEYLKTPIRKKKGRKHRLQQLGAVGCLCLIIFSLYTILKWHADNTKIQQIKKELDQELQVEDIKEKGELVNPPSDKNSNYYYYAGFPFYEVNFSSLLSKNGDTVGFLRIKNTNISYPIVQAKDNDYYLNHDFYKNKNQAGWIFLDYRSSLDPLNDNTVIYGHARLDGTIFGSLKNVLTDSWQENRDNYVIFLSTPKENMVFQIFSIYTIPSEGYYIQQSFRNDKKKQDWLQTMKKRNIAPIETQVDSKDKILTLSTCQNVKDGRLVVHAKLIKSQKREL